KKPLSSNSLQQQILTLERQRRELLEVNKQWDHQFRSMKQLYEKQVTMLTTSVAICVPPSGMLSLEALHEMKEENRLLKQKNASMSRRKEYYESEISRLNKVGAGVTGETSKSSLQLRPVHAGSHCLAGSIARRKIQRVFGFSCETSLHVMSKPLLHPPSSEQRGNGTKMLLYAPSEGLWLKRKVT
uniref:TNFAIP3 interacting protein 3 n=1 Tax=Serinus canaria TaxID=9135 RepID=A0A8C9L461_SERCA